MNVDHWPQLALKVAIAFVFAFVTFQSADILAQSRDEKVRNDRESLKEDAAWYYDDLASGLEVAAEANMPLMVVLRCIP